jgi:hypothetical protein
MLAEQRPVLSFGFFPPRTDEGRSGGRSRLHQARQDHAG